MNIRNQTTSTSLKTLRYRNGESDAVADSGSSKDERTAIAKLLSQAISEHVVADAPPDHDDVMASIPRSPGWACALFGASAVAGLWSLIIFAARALMR